MHTSCLTPQARSHSRVFIGKLLCSLLFLFVAAADAAGVTTDAAGNGLGNVPFNTGETFIFAPPSLASATPNTGSQGATLSVAIVGTNTNFVNGTSAVTFSGAGITVNSTTVTDATHASANITISGAAATTARDVTVTTTSEVVTLTGGFTVTAGTPTVTLVTPSQGPITGGTLVTITGTNLTGASAVTFGGVAATSVTPVSANSVTCVTPAAAAGGPVSVIVTATAGTNVANTAFAYVQVPVVLSGGGVLTVDGTGSTTGLTTTIKRSGGNLVITDPTHVLGYGPAPTFTPLNTITIPFASITSLTLTGSDKNDLFTLDFSADLPGTINIDGRGQTGSPGDGLAILSDNGDYEGTYIAQGLGGGTWGVTSNATNHTSNVIFTGLEPIDATGIVFTDEIVDLSHHVSLPGKLVTTVSAVGPGLANTQVSFDLPLESVTYGSVTGSLTIKGDATDDDRFVLVGLGTAMQGDFIADGNGGAGDIIECYNTTFAVTGAAKNLSLKSGFIGIGDSLVGAPTPGVLVCSGNITLEATGDSTLGVSYLWGPAGLWGDTPTVPWFNSSFLTPGTIHLRGDITKTSGSDATLTLKAKGDIFSDGASLPTATDPLFGGDILNTAPGGKLNVVINSDSDSLNGGVVSLNRGKIATGGGTLTIGGGATPATTYANVSGTSGVGVTISGMNILTTGGNVSILGKGGLGNGVTLSAVAGLTNGVSGADGSSIIDSGAGSITVDGQAGTASGAHGVRLLGPATITPPVFVKLTSSTGNISVTGTAGAGSGQGVFLSRAASIATTGIGSVTVTGTGTGSTGGTSGIGIILTPILGATSAITSAGGNVSLIADKMNLAGTGAGTLTVSASGSVTLKPLTAALAVNLGSSTDATASTLELSTTELGKVTAPTLTIGSATSGTITVSQVITPTTYSTLAFAKDVSFAATGGFTSTVSSASNYNKMTVAGTATIDGSATLSFASGGGYVWNGTDNFAILTNDAADAISGAFSPPTLTTFLGSALTAVLSYTAGTGNDLVIGAAPTVTANTGAYLLSATTLIITGTGFDAVTPGNNIVTFSGGVTGVVTAATSTQLTVTLTGPVLGPLTAVVTNGLSSGAPVQVANFINLPILNINDVANVEGNSGTSTYTFTVSLDVPAAFGGVTFDIATADNTATTADSDYVAFSVLGVNIPAGSSSGTLFVTVNGDTTFEPNETFAVNITNVVGASVNDGSALGTITNDDAAPTLSINNTTIAEGNAGTTTLGFTVSLSSASSQTVTVLATTADGSATLANTDYATNSQLITFNPGDTSKAFNVTVTGDTNVETDETMYVRLTCPVNSTISGGTGIGTITNDDGGTGRVYVVNSNVDVDPSTWSSLNLTNGQINATPTVTLRSAVLAANQSGVGPHLIKVPGNIGTYTLNQDNPTNSAVFHTNGGFDLVVGDHLSTIVIQGFNGQADILQASVLSDVMTTGLQADGFTPSIVNLSLDNLKLRGGAFTGLYVGADDGLGNVSRTQITNCAFLNNNNADGSFGQGGAIQDTGGFLTISDTTFTNNTATNTATGQGGAIYFSLPNAVGQGSVGALSVLNCTFLANSGSLASGPAGGAIYVSIISAGTNTLIKGCTFDSNVAFGAADGAALAIDGARTTDILNNNFTGNFVNTAGGHGGAIAVNTGATNINFNRFSANTVITAANGSAIYRAPTATGTVNASNNWWKANSGPPVNAIVGTVTNTSNINLKVVAAPTSIPLLGTSTLTADFFTTSTATTLTLPQVSALVGLPSVFGSATFGAVTASDTSLQCDGKALATFTGGAVAGVGGASVTIDGQTVSAAITVGVNPADSTLVSLSASAGALSPAFAPATIGYAVSTPSATTTTTITPTANNPGATLAYNVNGGGFTGIATGATSAPITLNAVGIPTPIVVHVISPDTTTTKDYTITVTRVASGGPPVTVLTSATDTPPGVPGSTWDSIRSGMTIASSGAVGFRAHLALGGAIDANNFQGIWKSTDGSIGATSLVARSGITAAPGVAGGLFDTLPLNPIINNAAQSSFVGFLRVGTGGVTASTDTGVWTELGTGGLKLALREGGTIGGDTMGTISPSGWVSGGSSALAFSVRLAPTGTALVRATVAGAVVTPTIVAKQGVAAPVMSGGTAGNFDNLGGNYSDPRVDAAGDLAFAAGLSTGGVGIWYSPVAGGVNAVANDGQAAPGLGGPTFVSFERPSLSADGSTIAFRAFVTGANGQTVFKGNPAAPAGLVAIAKSNDTTLPGIPVGSKLWSIWSPFTNNTGKVAFRVSMLDGASAETRAIVTDTDGTLKVIAKVGDVAPGFGAETFVNFDHPIIGDGNQTAFIASTSGGNTGIFRQAAGGGALALVTKVGDVITITGGGTETILSMTLPGSGSDDRKYETKAIDATGRILVHVLYGVTAKTGVVLTAP